MSITGVGPALAVEGPLPAPPAYNIFTVAQALSANLTPDGDLLERWRNGISLRAYPPGVPTGFDPCSTGTFRTKDEGEPAPISAFLPFTAYVADFCSALGLGPWPEFQARTNAVLTATEAFALERQLAQGDPMNDNPFLGDANMVEVGPGGALNPGAALAYLEQAIAGTGRAGVIHATPAIAAAWSALGYTLERVAGGVAGGSLRTVGNWTPVIVGSGYTGTDPVADDSPGAGWGWAFATGPIVYGRSAELMPVPETEREALDRTNNDVVYRAERDMLVAWDTVLQAGVLVDWS